MRSDRQVSGVENCEERGDEQEVVSYKIKQCLVAAVAVAELL
jgi:hypothetical protein